MLALLGSSRDHEQEQAREAQSQIGGRNGLSCTFPPKAAISCREQDDWRSRDKSLRVLHGALLRMMLLCQACFTGTHHAPCCSIVSVVVCI